MQFISCDIETIGTSVNSSIIQIGLCICDHHYFCTASELIKPDLIRSDNETLDWWRDQDNYELIDRARAVGVPSMAEAWINIFKRLRIDVIDAKDQDWWFRYPQFDEAMLRHQWVALWNRQRVKDQKTLESTVRALGLDPEKYAKNIERQKHDAGKDALRQAQIIKSCMTVLQEAVSK